jgi:hypothetical protein
MWIPQSTAPARQTLDSSNQNHHFQGYHSIIHHVGFSRFGVYCLSNQVFKFPWAFLL